MAVSLYDISISVFLRYLNNLSALLKKGETYADENSIPHSKILEARLAPDMKPFTYQIQRVSDTAKGFVVRVAGTDPVSMPDNETTFEELQARIAKTIEVLKGVSEESVNGKDESEIVLKMPKREYKFTGKSFVLDYAMPNFFFHVNMTYALLRKEGVPVGKMDYLGGVF